MLAGGAYVHPLLWNLLTRTQCVWGLACNDGSELPSLPWRQPQQKHVTTLLPLHSAFYTYIYNAHPHNGRSSFIRPSAGFAVIKVEPRGL